MNTKTLYAVCIPALLFFISLASCTKPGTVKKEETIMGTRVTITVAADTAEEGETAIDAAMDEIRRLDEMMSLYKDESEITQVNMAAGRHPVTVSPEMIEVVQQAITVSRLTGGVFDITAGPLIVLWQMRLKENRIPAEKEIQETLGRVNFRHVVIDTENSTIFLRNKNMIMDLGGVAKGYAADKAAEVLKEWGIRNGIVAVAGDIMVLGRRPDGTPWRIGVQHPREKDAFLTTLELSDTFISTSGDYERFVIRESKRYHHIIDPRTGRPSKGVISATIIGDRGVIIDPLTTAIFILGTEKGMEIVKKLGYEAIFLGEDGTISATDGIPLQRN